MRGTSVNTTLIRSDGMLGILFSDLQSSINKQWINNLCWFNLWGELMFFFFSSSSTSSVFAQQALLLSNILTFLCCSCLNWIFHSGRCRGSDTVVMRIAAPFQQQRIHYKGFLSFFPLCHSLSFLSLSLFFTICMKAAWGVETLSESCPKSRVHTLQGE